jgi:hypothetical protein
MLQGMSSSVDQPPAAYEQEVAKREYEGDAEQELQGVRDAGRHSKQPSRVTHKPDRGSEELRDDVHDAQSLTDKVLFRAARALSVLILNALLAAPAHAAQVAEDHRLGAGRGAVDLCAQAGVVEAVEGQHEVEERDYSYQDKGQRRRQVFEFHLFRRSSVCTASCLRARRVPRSRPKARK